MLRWKLRASKLWAGEARFRWLLCALPLLNVLICLTWSLSSDPIQFAGSISTFSRRGLTIGYPWVDPNAGFTIQALGGLSAKLWMSGQVPWWNPYMGLGVPLAAEMQPFSLCLPFVLLLQFSNGVLLLKLVLQALSGLATYGLLRQLKLSPMAAATGAIVFEFNGTFALFADMPILPIAFLPLLLWGIERAFCAAKTERRGGWTLVAVALAYSLYAGFPESAYLNGLLGLAWSFYRTGGAGRRVGLRFASKITIGSLSGILLSLPILVPFFEYLRQAEKVHASLSHVGLSRIGFAGSLMPFLFGPIHGFSGSDPTGALGQYWGATGGYLDLVVLSFAACAIVTGKRLIGLRILLIVWIGIFLARILNIGFVDDLLKFVPGLDMVAVYRYCQPSCSMAAAVLVGMAFEDVCGDGEARRRALRYFLVFSTTLAGVAVWNASGLIRTLLVHDARYLVWLKGSIAWAIVFVMGITLAVQLGKTQLPRLLAALLGVNAVALCLLPQFAGLRNAKLDLALVQFLQQHIGLSRMYTFGALAPNYGSYLQIASVNYNAFPVPRSVVNYIHSTMDPGAHPILFTGFLPEPRSDRKKEFLRHLHGFEEAGVRYVLTSPHEELGAERGTAARVYRGVVADVWELPHPAPYFESEEGHCKLSYTTREQVDAVCDSSDVLIRHELYYPGWRAAINSGRLGNVSAGRVFQEVRVPQGVSRLQFRYAPTALVWALAGALGGLALLLLGALRPHFG